MPEAGSLSAHLGALPNLPWLLAAGAAILIGVVGILSARRAPLARTSVFLALVVGGMAGLHALEFREASLRAAKANAARTEEPCTKASAAECKAIAAYKRGMAARRDGNDEEALHQFTVAINILLAEGGDSLMEGNALRYLSALYLRRHNVNLAEFDARLASDTYKALGHKAEQAESQLLRGDALVFQREFPRAEEAYRLADRLFAEAGQPAGRERVKRQLARMTVEKSNPNLQIARLEQDRDRFLAAGDRKHAADTSRAIAEAFGYRNMPQAALPHLADALKIYRDLKRARDEADTLHFRAVFLMGDRRDLAVRDLEAAATIYRRIGDAPGLKSANRMLDLIDKGRAGPREGSK